jgi:hypothetical protein
MHGWGISMGKSSNYTENLPAHHMFDEGKLQTDLRTLVLMIPMNPCPLTINHEHKLFDAKYEQF